MKRWLILMGGGILGVLLHIGCSGPKCATGELNADGSCSGGSQEIGSVEFGRSGLVEQQKWIGVSLVEYPELQPLNNTFTSEVFNSSPVKDEAKAIYLIEVDHAAQEKAVDKLLSFLKSDDGEIVEKKEGSKHSYRTETKRLLVDHETGFVAYHDLLKTHKHPGIKEIDRKAILSAAQSYFEEYLSEESLKASYFYRYWEYINSVASGDKQSDDLIYELAIALNYTIDGIPVVGSGGKNSVHLQPDGSLAAATFSFVRFVKDPSLHPVSLYGKDEALQHVNSLLEQRERSLSDHVLSRKEFGYYFRTWKGKVKWVVPSYTFVLEPHTGVQDKKLIFEFPASHDVQAIEAFKYDEEQYERRVERKHQPYTIPFDTK